MINILVGQKKIDMRRKSGRERESDKGRERKIWKDDFQRVIEKIGRLCTLLYV